VFYGRVGHEGLSSLRIFKNESGESDRKMERRLIGVKDLAEYLGITVNTVYSWVSTRKIPFTKLGKLVKFDLKEIDLLIARLKVEPNMEVML
jgi:excisionase family DNA binding protein